MGMALATRAASGGLDSLKLWKGLARPRKFLQWSSWPYAYSTRYRFPELWMAQSLSGNPPSVSYDEVMADDEGVGRWMTKLVRMSPAFLPTIC